MAGKKKLNTKASKEVPWKCLTCKNLFETWKLYDEHYESPGRICKIYKALKAAKDAAVAAAAAAAAARAR